MYGVQQRTEVDGDAPQREVQRVRVAEQVPVRNVERDVDMRLRAAEMIADCILDLVLHEAQDLLGQVLVGIEFPTIDQ